MICTKTTEWVISGHHLARYVVNSPDGFVMYYTFAELFAHLGQGPTLGVTELDPSLNLVAYDTIFSHERLDAKEEIFP